MSVIILLLFHNSDRVSIREYLGMNKLLGWFVLDLNFAQIVGAMESFGKGSWLFGRCLLDVNATEKKCKRFENRS